MDWLDWLINELSAKSIFVEMKLVMPTNVIKVVLNVRKYNLLMWKWLQNKFSHQHMNIMIKLKHYHECNIVILESWIFKKNHFQFYYPFDIQYAFAMSLIIIYFRTANDFFFVWQISRKFVSSASFYIFQCMCHVFKGLFAYYVFMWNVAWNQGPP